MNASAKSSFDTGQDHQGFEALLDASSARGALGSVSVTARASVVNRTHRVVRQRAKAMQVRRSRMRSLWAPMIICSALLLLIASAVWMGLYQSPANAAELAQSDVAGQAMAATVDATNHSMVALLWFVPVCLAVPALVLYRRRRESVADKAGR